MKHGQILLGLKRITIFLKADIKYGKKTLPEK
jgi:hypothetical protein